MPQSESLRKWALNKTKWTLSEVADYVTECGSHYFTRETMKFFGDTRANFRAVMIGPRVFVTRVAKGRKDAGRAQTLGRLCPVDFERGCIGVAISDAEESEIRDLYRQARKES